MGNPTLPNTKLPVGQWINLYAAITTAKGSTVAVGTAIGIRHLTTGTLQLCVSAVAPTDSSGYEPLGPGEYAENEPGDVGFWAKSPFTDATVNLREV